MDITKLPRSFIAFVDDDGSIKDTYGTIIQNKEGLLTIQTDTSIITIPIVRLLKIKTKIEEYDGN